MTRRAKILIDECLSKPAIQAIRGFLALGSEPWELAHQLDVYGQGADDTVWVPEAAKDGWTVVTADRGKHSKVEAKLPLLCEAYGVTHVLMSGSLSKRIMRFRVLKIQEHWSEIVAAASGQAGARYSIALTGPTSSRMALIKAPAEDDRPKRQKYLTD